MITKAILKYKWAIIALAGVLTTFSVWLLPQLTTNVEFTSFFPEGDHEVLYYEGFTDKLGSNDHFLVAALVPEQHVFNQNFLASVDQFTQASANIPNIESASSITNLSRYVKSPFGLITLPYIHLNEQDKLEQDSVLIYKDYGLTQQYIPHDASCLLVILKLKENLSLETYDTTIAQVESLVMSYDFPESHLMGKKLIEVHYKRLMSQELPRSIIGSLGLIIVLLLLFYRSIKGATLPLLTIIVTLIIFYGFLALTGRSLGIMSSLYPTIILIVGISDSIHILTKYNLAIREGLTSKEAVKKVISEVGLSVLLTSFTTVVGFLTLTTSVMPALQNFGIDASIGIILAFLISVLLLPAILLLLPAKKTISTKERTLNWPIISSWIHQKTSTSKRWILSLTGLTILVSCLGILKINTNNLQLTNIPESNTLKKDYTYFDENLGGARTFELAIEITDTSLLNQAHNLADIRQIHEYLDSLPLLNYLVSPITYYHGISKLFNRGLSHLEIPLAGSGLEKYEKTISPYTKNIQWRVVDESKKYGRITARIPDLGRLEVKKLNQKITDWVNQEIDTSRMTLRPVGMDLMIDQGHEHRISNMIWGILLALLVISVLIGLLFRKTSMVIITLIANVIPLIMIAGLMGFSGIELRGTTSIIFAIGFVIAVDDTIHFLSKYRIEKQKGLSVDQAIQVTLQEAGKAIFTTSVILFGGFMVLLTSSFGDVYSVGFMVGFMILFALILDLFLVPVLLRIADKQGNE